MNEQDAVNQLDSNRTSYEDFRAIDEIVIDGTYSLLDLEAILVIAREKFQGPLNAAEPRAINFPVVGDFRTPTVTLFWYVFVFRRPDGTEFEDTKRFPGPGPDPAMLQYESEQIKAGMIPLRLIEYTQDVEHQ